VNRISSETIFVTAEHKATNGIIGVNKKGQVLSVKVDEQTIILTTLNNTGLTFNLASRVNLPGADDLYVKQYQQLFKVVDMEKWPIRPEYVYLCCPTAIVSLTS
jgi:clathrin heavy chain